MVLRKLVSFFSLLAILVTSAHASSVEGLKAAFDELNYTLTVEWDQKDNRIYESAQAKFMTTIRALKMKGLTDDEFSAFVRSQVSLGGYDRETLTTILNSLSQTTMSEEEALALVQNIFNNNRQRGASWDGATLGVAAFGVLVISFFVVAYMQTDWSIQGRWGPGSSSSNGCQFGLVWQNVCDSNGENCRFTQICM